MTLPRLLVVEGNTREARDALARSECRVSGELYAATLKALCPDATVQVLKPTDGERLPEGVTLADFDGIAWTGSALNIYDDTPPIRVQVELMRAALHAGAPVFGSCWGLQVATVAAGGTVRRNPRGREFGIARNIALTQAGLTHPMYRGKGRVFAASAIHFDEVETLPEGALVLAENPVSAVQAMTVHWAGGEFWGVQYHPEFDLAEIGRYARRYADALTREGFFTDPADAAAWGAQCIAAKETGRSDLCWKLGVGDDVLDDSMRLRELANWLAVRVRRRAAQR